MHSIERCGRGELKKWPTPSPAVLSFVDVREKTQIEEKNNA